MVKIVTLKDLRKDVLINGAMMPLKNPRIPSCFNVESTQSEYEANLLYVCIRVLTVSKGNPIVVDMNEVV